MIYDQATQPPAPAEPRFNLVEAALGVITRPTVAMRQIARARPWLIALILYVVLSLLSNLAQLAAPAPAFMPADPALAASPELERFQTITQNLLAGMRSPPFILASALVLSPLMLVLGAGVLYLVARMLRGHGPFSALFSTLAFASLPSILLAPITALVGRLGGGAVAAVACLSFAVSIWIIVLQIIGVRESMEMSTGRAVATWFIPLGIVIFLAIVAVCLVIALAVGASGSG